MMPAEWKHTEYSRIHTKLELISGEKCIYMYTHTQKNCKQTYKARVCLHFAARTLDKSTPGNYRRIFIDVKHSHGQSALFIYFYLRKAQKHITRAINIQQATNQQIHPCLVHHTARINNNSCVKPKHYNDNYKHHIHR